MAARVFSKCCLTGRRLSWSSEGLERDIRFEERCQVEARETYSKPLTQELIARAQNPVARDNACYRTRESTDSVNAAVAV